MAWLLGVVALVARVLGVLAASALIVWAAARGAG